MLRFKSGSNTYNVIQNEAQRSEESLGMVEIILQVMSFRVQ
jgi:hypothetical protein